MIQWNSNGISNKLEMVAKLITDQNPNIICFQESHFKKYDFRNLKNYKCFFKNRTNVEKASGGVATYIEEGLICEEYSVISSLESVVVSIFINNKKINICNVYLPNSQQLRLAELENLIEQLPKPYIIVGDFDSHNYIWGSNHIDERGKTIEQLIEKFQLILLNNTSATHFNAADAKSSIIDLTFCSEDIAENLEYFVLDELYSSDNYPISTSFIGSAPTLPKFKEGWKLNSANWPLYQEILDTELKTVKSTINLESSGDINNLINKFDEAILSAAEIAIPKRSVKLKKKEVPWWNDKCAEVLKLFKKAKNRYRRHKSIDTKIEHNRLRALLKKTYKDSQKESWLYYISSIK